MNMKIKLKALHIRNFKGIAEYGFATNGESVNVSGDNGTGKTSLYDAFLWALFGKDSTDKTAFDWKPLDKDNNEIHHLETEVEVKLDIDGQEKVLSRMTKEDWVNKRGSIHETFGGHTTTYKIDGINAKQKDYKAYLDELIGEDTFRMLTNINYFPEKLDWKKRRQILIDMAGDISDEDVINSNSDLKPLLDLVGDKSIDDITTLSKQRMKEINKQIKELPSRIDEVDRSLPDLSELDKQALTDKQALLNKQIEAKRSEISNIENGLEVGKLKQDKKELQLHYKELEQEHISENGKQTDYLYEENKDLNNQLIELKTKLHAVESKEKDLTNAIERGNERIAELEKDNVVFREKFIEKKKEQMEPFDEHRTTCQTCGQELPEDQLLKVQENYQQQVEEFNSSKSQYLEDINSEGRKNNEEIETIKWKNKELQRSIDSLDTRSIQNEISDVQEKLATIGERINHIESHATPFKDTEKAKEVIEQGEVINRKIETLQNNAFESIATIQAEVKELNNEVNEVFNDLFKFTQHEKLSKRKDELVEEEQLLSSEYGKLEQRIFMLEEFVRTKVNLLTESINNRFKYVKFKLFETKINGGLEEVCEPTVNGANYSTGLNNAARINAGLDIVNTLMKEEGITVPVFIDNAEGVNDFIDINTQLITLSVTKHKALRVETL